MRRTRAMLVMLGMTACSNGAGPEPEFQLSFDLAPADTIIAGDSVIFTWGQVGILRDLRPVVASAGAGEIRVLGSFVSSCSGPLPASSTERTPDGVTLQISFPPPGHHTCTSMPQPFTYEARFLRVPPGTHRVRVRHLGDYLRPDGIVLEERVQVD